MKFFYLSAFVVFIALSMIMPSGDRQILCIVPAWAFFVCAVVIGEGRSKT